MAGTDRQRWNRRYSEMTRNFEPSGWLVAREARLHPDHPGARALDLACGPGHNSLYLARIGYRVDAWDISDVALDRLRAQVGVLDVRPCLIDLDGATIPPAAYDLLLDLNFLDRHLLPSMARALRPGGLLVMRTLMRKPARDDREPAHLLDPGELHRAFADLAVAEYEEDSEDGWAAIVARRRPPASSAD
jgi:tellurite methyltransferase